MVYPRLLPFLGVAIWGNLATPMIPRRSCFWSKCCWPDYVFLASLPFKYESEYVLDTRDLDQMDLMHE